MVELGAGRREMAAAFAEWRYVPVDVDGGALPERFRGVVFSNEFFDALPVEAAVVSRRRVPRAARGARRRALRLGATAARRRADVADYLAPLLPAARRRPRLRSEPRRARWMERIAGGARSGYVFTIDYGYTRAESVRFPRGTLMSYRRHTAREDVLREPGRAGHHRARELHRASRSTARRAASQRCASKTLARTLLDAGEAGPVRRRARGRARAAGDWQRTLQLKTLLFGMGETFRTLLQRKARRGEPKNEKGPGNAGPWSGT